MANRFNFMKVLPDGYKALSVAQKYINESGLDKTLALLIRLRSSQINGCIYCLEMHLNEARDAGFSDLRLFTLSAWHESPFFDEKEKAILALTDAMTLISEEGLDDEIYDDVLDQLGEEDFAKAMMAICQINTWNRLMLATEAPAPSANK